jgi:hypothetical protein
MYRHVLVSALFILSVFAEREFLDKDRDLPWKIGNPNLGVYRGQPEQVHLSYGGMFWLLDFKNVCFKEILQKCMSRGSLLMMLGSLK